MFQIPVSELLLSYTGDSKSFSFSWEVFDGYFEDINFREPLQFTVKMMTLDDGLSVSFEKLETVVEYEGKRYNIHISSFDRIWKNKIDPLEDADDVREINIKNMTIDLAPVIREEIIMACHEL